MTTTTLKPKIQQKPAITHPSLAYIPPNPPASFSEDGMYVSEQVYWEHYYNHPYFSYEWNNGILEEKPVSDNATDLMYTWFLQLINVYLQTYPIAQTTVLETGGRISLVGETVIRKPDLGLVLNSNPTPYKLKDRSYKGSFDLCVEAVSKSTKEDIERDTIQKKREYQLSGVKEYYILDSDGEETAFYRLNKKGNYEQIETGQENIIQSEVLPGFCFRISDLYQRPSLEVLSNDKLYANFVLPFYQKEKERANQAEQRAAQAEAENARLKALLENLQSTD